MSVGRIARNVFTQSRRVNRFWLRGYHGRQTDHSMSDAYVVDLRSDVLTRPWPAMKQAMTDATWGDDVFDEDPTVHKLQEKCAEMFGMESALFVASGTMGNLMCVLLHCQTRGLEAIFGDKTHMIFYEQGGVAQLGGVFSRPIENLPDGTFDIDALENFYIRPRNDPHQPYTGVVVVENTHAYSGGRILPLDFLAKLKVKANSYGIPVHMDGARVLNAAAGLNKPLKEVLKDVDSVSLCMSKGVGAPVGTVIGGTAEFIARGVRLRKVLGGGWRQPGPLAAASLLALEDAVPRFQEEHRRAKKISNAIMEKSNGVVSIDEEGVQTNLVIIDMVKAGLSPGQLCDRLAQVRDEEQAALKARIVVHALPSSKTAVRLVTYTGITDEDIEMVIKKLHYVLDEMAQ